MKLGGFDTLIHRAPCLPFPPAHPPAHPLLRHPTTLAAWSTAPVAPLPISGDETEEKDQARGRNVEKRQRWNGMQGGANAESEWGRRAEPGSSAVGPDGATGRMEIPAEVKGARGVATAPTPSMNHTLTPFPITHANPATTHWPPPGSHPTNQGQIGANCTVNRLASGSFA